MLQADTQVSAELFRQSENKVGPGDCLLLPCSPGDRTRSPGDSSADSSSKGSTTQLYESKCPLPDDVTPKVGCILLAGYWLIFSIKLDTINILINAQTASHKRFVYCPFVPAFLSHLGSSHQPGIILNDTLPVWIKALQ